MGKSRLGRSLQKKRAKPAAGRVHRPVKKIRSKRQRCVGRRPSILCCTEFVCPKLPGPCVCSLQDGRPLQSQAGTPRRVRCRVALLCALSAPSPPIFPLSRRRAHSAPPLLAALAVPLQRQGREPSAALRTGGGLVHLPGHRRRWRLGQRAPAVAAARKCAA